MAAYQEVSTASRVPVLPQEASAAHRHAAPLQEAGAILRAAVRERMNCAGCRAVRRRTGKTVRQDAAAVPAEAAICFMQEWQLPLRWFCFWLQAG